jgi:glycosyltransferase involved in cell wall biosynthesis
VNPDRYAVVIPACDEEQTIERCVASLRRAAETAELDHERLHIVVVADSCSDATARLARRALGRGGEVFEVVAGSAGAARAIGTTQALQHWLDADPQTVWTAHTDADTFVPIDWIAQQRIAATAGFAAVAGVVEVESFSEHLTGTEARHRAIYNVGLDDHPHVHGANLAVRADAYLAAGGWLDLASGEDQALWAELRRLGYPCLSTRAIRVVTSGRRVGRASAGFASYLCELGSAG